MSSVNPSNFYINSYEFFEKSDEELRFEFARQFLTQMIPGLIFRFGYRIVDLLALKPVLRGMKKAEKLPNKSNCSYIKTVSVETVSAVIKVVIFPLAVISLQFIALFGLFVPQKARTAYAAVENFFALDESEVSLTEDSWIRSLFNYSAASLQSEKVIKQRKIFDQHNDTTLYESYYKLRGKSVDAFYAVWLVMLTIKNLFFSDTRLDPEKENEGSEPVLLVHGFLSCSNHLNFIRKSLEEKGFSNIYSIDFGNPCLSIDDYAHKLSIKINSIGSEKIHVIAHSMGGRVLQNYMEKFGTAKINKCVFLLSPICGTKVARILAPVSKAAKDMCPDSESTQKAITYFEKNNTKNHLFLGSIGDCTVFPLATCAPKGAQNKLRTYRPIGHLEVLYSKEVVEIIKNFLQEQEIDFN